MVIFEKWTKFYHEILIHWPSSTADLSRSQYGWIQCAPIMKIEHITMFYVIKIYVSNSILFIKINIFKIYI